MPTEIIYNRLDEANRGLESVADLWYKYLIPTRKNREHFSGLGGIVWLFMTGGLAVGSIAGSIGSGPDHRLKGALYGAASVVVITTAGGGLLNFVNPELRSLGFGRGIGRLSISIPLIVLGLGAYYAGKQAR